MMYHCIYKTESILRAGIEEPPHGRTRLDDTKILILHRTSVYKVLYNSNTMMTE